MNYVQHRKKGVKVVIHFYYLNPNVFYDYNSTTMLTVRNKLTRFYSIHEYTCVVI